MTPCRLPQKMMIACAAFVLLATAVLGGSGPAAAQSEPATVTATPVPGSATPAGSASTIYSLLDASGSARPIYTALKAAQK